MPLEWILDTISSEKAPSICFVIPTLNAESYLESCLTTIVNQEYPKDKVRIMVMDANSKDGTRELALKYGCEVHDNPKIFPDPGVYLGMEMSNDELQVAIAGDNGLPDKFWIQHMARPFLEDPSIAGSFTDVINSPREKPVTRYINLLNADPLNWYVYGNLVRPDRFGNSVKIIKKTPHYVVYDFQPDTPPMLGYAQAFVVRKSFVRDPSTAFDAILPVHQMIRERRKIAYVPKAGAYHHTLDSFRHFLHKYDERIQLSLRAHEWGYKARMKALNKERKRRQILWFIYSVSLIAPLIDAVRYSLKDRDAAWFYHPIACFVITALIWRNVARHYLHPTEDERFAPASKSMISLPQDFVPQLLTLPSISVIIPTLNSGRLLRSCLSSILAQDYPKNKIEIVVVDGGSEDNTIDIANEYGCRVLSFKNERENPEGRKAIGIQHARNEMLLFIDSDNIIPHKNWLRRMLGPIINDNVVGTQAIRYHYDAGYSDLNRYFALIGIGDPVVYYLSKSDHLPYYDGIRNFPGKVHDAGYYFNVEFTPDDMPTIGANGFLVRKDMLLSTRCSPEDYFHIDVNLDLVNLGYKTYGFIKDDIIHLSFGHGATVSSYVAKRLTYMGEYHGKQKRRYTVYSSNRIQDRAALLKYILYTITLVKPVIDSIRGFRVVGDRAWFIHPIMCGSILISYGIAITRKRLQRK